MNCAANASTASDWIHSVLPVAEVTSTLFVHSKLSWFPFHFSSNFHMGKKNIFISSLKPYVNFLGKLVESPFSPLSYGKALSFTVVICGFGTPELRNSCLASVYVWECFYFTLYLCINRAAENEFCVCVWLKEKRATGVKDEEDIICIFRFT